MLGSLQSKRPLDIPSPVSLGRRGTCWAEISVTHWWSRGWWSLPPQHTASQTHPPAHKCASSCTPPRNSSLFHGSTVLDSFLLQLSSSSVATFFPVHGLHSYIQRLRKQCMPSLPSSLSRISEPSGEGEGSAPGLTTRCEAPALCTRQQSVRLPGQRWTSSAVVSVHWSESGWASDAVSRKPGRDSRGTAR